MVPHGEVSLNPTTKGAKTGIINFRDGDITKFLNENDYQTAYELLDEPKRQIKFEWTQPEDAGHSAAREDIKISWPDPDVASFATI